MTPRVHGPRRHETARNEKAPPTPPSPSRGQTILVVDDDADVRAATRRTLESLGYDVVEAADGVDAVNAVRERAGNVALVLTDVVMWGMGGGELSVCLSSLYPATRLLFMSGYRQDVLRKKGLMPPGGVFVAKPFEPDALAATIRKLLSGT